MKTLILKNGISVDFVECYSKNEYIQGIQRSVLDFRFDPNKVSLNSIDELFSSENCSKLTIDDHENQFIYDNYNIRVSISKQKFTLISEAGVKEEIEQISVKMAQLSYIEIQLAALGIKI